MTQWWWWWVGGNPTDGLRTKKMASGLKMKREVILEKTDYYLWTAFH